MTGLRPDDSQMIAEVYSGLSLGVITEHTPENDVARGSRGRKARTNETNKRSYRSIPGCIVDIWHRKYRAWCVRNCQLPI